MSETFALVLMGLAAGVLSGLFGLGGGFLLVPMLVFSGWALTLAIGTSLVYVAMMGVGGALTHYRRHNLDVTFVAWFSTMSVVGAQGGAYVSTLMPEAWLAIAFSLFLVYVAWTMRPSVAAPEGLPTRAPALAPTLGLGAVVGVFSGLFGVGGGLLFVPAQMRLFGIPYKRAVGNSLAGVLVTGLSGAIGHAMYGHVAWLPALALVGGGVVGLRFGTQLMMKTPSPYLKSALAGFLVLMAGYLAFEAARTAHWI